MKALRLFAFFILQLNLYPARSAPRVDFQFQCFTNPLSTSMVATSLEDKILFRVIHHNGVKYTPIHFGAVTPQDLKKLEFKANLLAKLGDQFEVSFPKKKCSVFSHQGYECFSEGPGKIGGLDVDGYSFQTYGRESTIYEHTYHSMVATFSIEYDHTYFDITVEYMLENCKF